MRVIKVVLTAPLRTPTMTATILLRSIISPASRDTRRVFMKNCFPRGKGKTTNKKFQTHQRHMIRGARGEARVATASLQLHA